MKHFVCCIVCFFTCSMPLGAAQDSLDTIELEQKAYETGLSAYFFFYPLIVMELTRLQSIVTRAGMNQFFHSSGLPPAADKLVVRMNADTLYSMAWVDISSEPQIFTVPASENHPYVFQFLDAWSDVFANPGTRVTGADKASFALVPLCWQGALPDGVQKIECPTDLVWIIGRIVLDNEQDISYVQKLQTGFTLTPLSGWEQKKSRQPVLQDKKTPIDYSLPAPVEQLEAMNVETYFDMAMSLLQTTRTHTNDWPLMTDLTALGVVAGGSFKALNPEVIAGIKRGFDRAIELLKNGIQYGAQQTVNGWYMDTRIGTYGTDYFTRALIAKIGLGALLPQDTLYPSAFVDSDGQQLNGKNKYRLHFEHDKQPPVQAFWSVTLYSPESFFVENRLHRYGLRSYDPLVYNKDGSLDLYIQHEEPAQDKVSNWLPAPEGAFNLSARLAWPKESALYGEWHMPGIKKQAKKWLNW